MRMTFHFLKKIGRITSSEISILKTIQDFIPLNSYISNRAFICLVSFVFRDNFS